MLRRILFVAGTLAALYACGAEPRFPTQTPASKSQYSLGDEKNQKVPTPSPKGVALVAIDPATRARATTIAAASGVVFVILLLVLIRTPGRLTTAGIAAAFFGPAVAILIEARRFTQIFTGYTSSPFDFAGFIVLLWNANQPLLVNLYGGSIALIILIVIVTIAKPDDATRSAIAIPTCIVIAGSVVAFLAFVSLTRLTAAIVDPIAKDPIVLSYEFASLGEAAQTLRLRLLLAIIASFVTAIVIIVTVVLSFTLRPLRQRFVVVLFALIVMLGSALLERMWCDVLETTALTGRFPFSFLTR